ncbi:OB-fold domain-containing protein [Streptomyces sp. APSN-46.1]|uniref:bifunctional MaoC family dehydratase N-terminal/OB-fold nucleic acid binding domain-containing protein n=1 Tax=Streptomyces sp. APSN-46.1 TaxID=2929049 RepID=UPI001FB2B1C4|nr:bifunctional MaoC family dehydratase N-terminal/OB-fold nucleic acid binding domain-containing protein [Streptomyces sp. APSN-46.1]MCJ1678768.1 OB-fold domain-containing protein [Streptomyces sp. APSN-46.1]
MTATADEPDGADEAARFHELLKAFEGRAAVTGGRAKDPVNDPMIRHWCEAMGDANPAYTGPDAIAPPTMLQAWTMGGLSGHTGRSSAQDELFALLDGAGCTSVVATDCEQEYVRPLRPGDAVTFDAVIESVSPRKTTTLGAGHFVTTRMDVHANGELAGTHRFRILKYAPPPKPTPRPKPTPAPKPTPEGQTPPQTRGKHPQRPPRRPRPVINRDNQGFWDGVRDHRLLIQRCTACGTLRFPWLPGCNACASPDWDTVEATGTGAVFSYVVMHHPTFPAFTAHDHPADAGGPGGPYAVALVELAEGVRMISNITGVPYDKVRIGMPVRLEFLRVDEELELPVFRGSDG